MSKGVAIILPKDVAHVVLTQWLCLKSLVRLDSALCAHWNSETGPAEVYKADAKISVKLYNPGRHAAAPNSFSITVRQLISSMVPLDVDVANHCAVGWGALLEVSCHVKYCCRRKSGART
jgi:hypothetical protein